MNEELPDITSDTGSPEDMIQHRARLIADKSMNWGKHFSASGRAEEVVEILRQPTERDTLEILAEQIIDMIADGLTNIYCIEDNIHPCQCVWSGNAKEQIATHIHKAIYPDSHSLSTKQHD